MKKIIVLVTILAFTVALVACNGGRVEDEQPNIAISKLFTAVNDAGDSPFIENNVIEIFNNSDKEVTLNGNLVVRVFINGSPTNVSNFPIEGTIAPNGFFVIIGPNHTLPDVATKANFVTDRNINFNGDDPVGLVWQNELFDQVGVVIGVPQNFSLFQTLIRKGELVDLAPSTDFSLTEPTFIGYRPNMWQYIGVWNHAIRTEAQMLEGPRLDPALANLPFVTEVGGVNTGGGGSLRVTIASIADGDTATFNDASGTLAQFGLNRSVRYHFINTPEVQSAFTQYEPWGQVASLFNRRWIHQGNMGLNQTIHISSIPGISPTDSTSSRRTMALVWVNGYLQQFFVVREGLSVGPATISAAESGLHYQNVLISSFLQFAQKVARVNGWGIWGPDANAPDWDSVNRRPIMTGWQDAWRPNLPLPW